MTIDTLAQSVALTGLALAFGSTAWFFFVQSPVLLRKLGRDAFVPLQMRLTLVLFRFLSAVLVLSLAATCVYTPKASFAFASLVVAALGALFNQLVMVPRALRSGGRSRGRVAGCDHEGTTANFASQGVGEGTKRDHRLVVLFVLVMLGGIVGHASTLVGS